MNTGTEMMNSADQRDTNMQIEELNGTDVEEAVAELNRVQTVKKCQRVLLILCLVIFIITGVFVVLHKLSSSPQVGKLTPGSSVKLEEKTPTKTGSKLFSNKGKDKIEEDTAWIEDSNGSKYRILDMYRRSSTHYTQGLYWDDGRIIESGGLYGQSSIQYLGIDEERKQILLKSRTLLKSQYFGEGVDKVTINGTDYIYQLTWRENKIFVYDTKLKQVNVLEKPNQIIEGWGITHRPSGPCEFIVSDSTDVLKVIDCNSMLVKDSLPIVKNEEKLTYINELEFVEDYLVANVYLTKNIEIIDLDSKQVVRTIDMSVLVDKANAERKNRDLGEMQFAECLNGIAYDRKKKEFWITGKDWPMFFKVQFPEEYFKRTK